jgi:hypothetical protein
VISVTAYNFELFNADLVGGGQIDFGSFSGALSVSKNLPVQQSAVQSGVERTG